MKKLLESAKPTNNIGRINQMLSKIEKLNQNAMKSIRGGDGEDNGGGDIIIIPHFPKK